MFCHQAALFKGALMPGRQQGLAFLRQLPLMVSSVVFVCMFVDKLSPRYLLKALEGHRIGWTMQMRVTGARLLTGLPISYILGCSVWLTWGSKKSW